MKNYTSAPTTRLLRRVAKHILEEPLRLDMDIWLSKKADEEFSIKPGLHRMWELNKEQPYPKCGTVGCIAGWALTLNGKKVTHNAMRSGAKILNLKPSIASKLFLRESWPTKFDIAYSKAATPRRRARVVADRIEHFIKTGE